MSLPGANLVFRQIVRSRSFVHSSLGFGSCFYDRKLLDGDFREVVIEPIIASGRRMEGQARALRGISWAIVDRLAETHAQIAAPVLLVWGEDDSIFPIERARPMAAFSWIQGPSSKLLRETPSEHGSSDGSWRNAVQDPWHASW